MLIHLLVNKLTTDYWKLCKHNHGHHSKTNSSIFVILEMKKMKEIPIHDYIKTKWIDLFPKDDTGNDSDLQLYVSIFRSV